MSRNDIWQLKQPVSDVVAILSLRLIACSVVIFSDSLRDSSYKTDAERFCFTNQEKLMGCSYCHE